MNKKIVSLILCISILCSFAAFSPLFGIAAPTLIVNESFNQYPTNDAPSNLNINSNTHYVTEHTSGDKALFVSTERKGSAFTYSFDSVEKLVVSFNIMTKSNNIKGALRLNISGKSFDILKFTNMNTITAHNGLHIGGYSQYQMNRYDVCVDSVKNCYDVYLNGKPVLNNYRIHNTTLSAVSGFSLVTEATDEASAAVLYDNINAHIGDKPQADYPVSDFNNEAYAEVEMKTQAEICVNRILNADFEETVPVKTYNKSNKMEVVDDGSNKSLCFERLNTSDFHMDALGVNGTGDYVIYDFDLKVVNPASDIYIQLKDVNGNYESIANISGGIIKLGSFSASITDGKWHNIATVYNYFDRIRNIYFDGELVLEGAAIGDKIGSSQDTNLFRIYCPAVSNAASAPVSFMLDNLRVYENDVPVADISQLKRTVTINRNKSVFQSDLPLRQMLSGFVAVHARSGMVYNNDIHTELSCTPYQNDDGIWMLPASELASLLDYSFAETDGNIVIGSTELTPKYMNIKDGVTYVDSDSFFAGKKIWHLSSTINSGLIIAGDKMFTAPQDPEELQQLNNFVFYPRPTPEMIAADYAASASNGKHPRIQATAADFARIKEMSKTNPHMQVWYNYIINAADGLTSDSSPLIYELRDGVRLLYVSRDALKYMYTLGMAYQLTGDQKYADRAWIDLEAVSRFPDWHPEHDIDLGEMCAAVAIGYDWMYDALTPEQRKIIEEGIYQNGFYDAVMAYQSPNGRLSTAAKVHTNHNIVVNGGIAMAGLAFMDIYPNICSYIVSGAVKGADWMLWRFAPSGAWYEGPGYWEYAMQYTSKMLSSLDSSLGTTYLLDRTQGLSTSSQYVLHMQSEQGIFNYGDASPISVYVPEMFWLSNKYNDILSTTVPLTLSGGKYSDAEDYALALLFYDPDKYSDSILESLPLQAYYEGEEVLTFRDKWSSEETTMAGIQGGETSRSNGRINYHSQLDAGSFIFDSMGVRWAKELGMSPYDLPEASDFSEYGTHWDLYRARAESHNTVIINPTDDPDHASISKADVLRFEAKPRGGIAVVDMSDVLRDNASAAKRGMWLTDERRSLVIRDEITLKKANSDVYWFMNTDADVELTENGAILRQHGREMLLTFVASTNAEISAGDSVPLPTSPVVKNDRIGEATRIAIKLPQANDSVTITVKLTPSNLWNPDDVSAYDIPIDTWQLPDGEIPKAPALDFLSIGGRNIELTESTTIDFVCVESEYTSVPDIVATANGCTVNVTKGNSLTEGASITVSDGMRATIYTVNFRIVPSPTQFEGSTSVPVVAVTVSDEPEPENGAFNVIDGDLSTRWSALGVEQWIKLELKDMSVIDRVALAFAQGDIRATKIQILVSTDDINYEEIFDGWSCGATLEHEFFDIGGKNVKYIKIGCDGNTAQGIGGWNSITEIVAMKNN